MVGQRGLQLVMVFLLLYPSPEARSQEARADDYFRHMEWRPIGPAVFGGRIPDVEAVPENPAVIYVAGSTGGVFKTTNNGVTWEPIFDDAGPTLSIGDMALAPSDPLILWVGTGESNGEQQAGVLEGGLDGGQRGQYAAGEDVALDPVGAAQLGLVGVVREGDDLDARLRTRLERSVDRREVVAVVLRADRLEHLDRDDGIVRAAEVAVVTQLDVDPVVEACLVDALAREVVLRL